jgi:hypothetical protein
LASNKSYAVPSYFSKGDIAMKGTQNFLLASLFFFGLIFVIGCSSADDPVATNEGLGDPAMLSLQKSGTQIYDATADFEVGWLAGSNPNGVWSYGWTNGIAGPLTLFTRNHIPIVNNNLEHMWDDPNNSSGFTPSVAWNAGGDFDDGNVTFVAGALLLHPCGIDGQAYAHVIWTAPVGGTYSLTSTFFAQQNGINVDVHILVNGISVFDNTITNNGVSHTFSDVFNLSAGETIDFAVGPNGEFNLHPGNTGLDATIQMAERVTICHKPGTPAQKIMVIPIQALAGHLGHGDKIGACE